MKIIFVAFLLCLTSCASSQTPNSWVRITDFSGVKRLNAISFSTDSFGYVGLGLTALDTFPYTRLYLNDLWQFNPSINSWSRKANFPGNGREGRICFTINGKAYVGLGDNYASGIAYNDIWEYDPVLDSWTQKADFRGGTRTLAIGFSIGSKGYVGLGWSDTSTSDKQDIWEYDPTNDTWTQKNNFTGGPRENAIALNIGGNAYVGFGDSSNSTIHYFNDLWQYNTVADSWIRKADFIGKPREDAFCFVIGTKGYVGAGIDTLGIFHKDFWEYNSLTDQWIEKDSFSGAVRGSAVAFSIGNKGYAGTGDTTSTEGLCHDFWMYTPDSIATGINPIDENTVFIFPNPSNGEFTINFGSAGIGNKTITLYNYLGQAVYIAGTDKSSMEVNTPLSAGVYTVMVIQNGQQTSTRIVIQ